MEMPWVKRKTFVFRIHEIDTGILTGFAGVHNFDQLFDLRLFSLTATVISISILN